MIMEGEFNELNYNNSNITFSTATDNIATSDELSASPIYQQQMGTKFSRGKKVGKAINIVGLSLIFTATAVASGSIITNIFIVNPPTVEMKNIAVSGNTLTYDFVIENKQNYKTTYFIELNRKTVYQESCSEAKEYSSSYEFDVGKKSDAKFYISFTNSFDYRKTIYTKSFVVGGN